MGRIHNALLLCLLVLATSVYFAPKLLTVNQVQSELVRQLELAMGADISMKEMRWRWAPLPHLTLFQAAIKNDSFVISLPKTRIYPNWKTLLHGTVSVGRLYLQSPKVTIKPSFYSTDTTTTLPQLPTANITVDEGSLYLAPYDNQNLQLIKNSFTHIQLQVRHTSDYAVLSMHSQASFASDINWQVRLFHNENSYSSSLAVKTFDLSKLISSAYGTIQPLPSAIDFGCDIIGQGHESISLLFDGSIPDFSLQRLDSPAPLKFSTAKLLLEKKGEEFSAKIYELGLSDPETTFSGLVKRYFPPDSQEAFYRLDLAAENIDLSAVRTKLLTLLGDNAITQTVCNIVRSGRAKSATYTFDAPLAGFELVSAMTINVDVDKADIHVPGVEIDLDRATGPIIIKDGNLFGHSITTWLDNNYGSNGSFAVGLSDDNWLFKLDLDIDADLTTLPQTLHSLIDDELFQQEVLKFSAQGRKNAHLTIGDDLRDFIVKVHIDDLAEAEVSYDRISWPISFRSGSLTIDGDRAEWDAASAIVGPHDLKAVSGTVSWADTNVPVTLHSLDALINAEELFAELNRFSIIKEYLEKDISSVSGIIAATNGSLHGPFFDPANWSYQMDVGMDIGFTTPHLPGRLTVNNANVHFDQDTFSMQECSLTFLENPLALSLHLSHSYFADWQGKILFSGQVHSSLGNWLKDKEWLNKDFFPQIPVNLENFQVDWQDDAVSILGTLSNRSLTGNPIEAVIDSTFSHGSHQKTSLHFFTDRNDGKITLSGDSIDSIDWQGKIAKKSVSAILSNQMILDGRIDGNFSLSLPTSDQNHLSLHGDAIVADLQWHWGDLLRQITIPWLAVQGEGEKITINDLHFLYNNDMANLYGDLLFSKDNVLLDLSLNSEKISLSTLTNFVDDLFSTLQKLTTYNDVSDQTTNTFAQNVSGQIQVKAEEFLFAESFKEGKSESYKLTPLQGKVDFSSPDSTILYLTDSDFCGLDINGILKWKNDENFKEFTLHSDEKKDPYFEDFLLCAGIDTEKIQGPFSLKAKLFDKNGTLTAGRLHLQSDKGMLSEMVVLSKVFKLINFSDFYQGMFSAGLKYKKLEVTGHVKNNQFIIDKAYINAEGLDVVAQGHIDLLTLEADLTLFIVPFKTIDKILNLVPLVGRIVGGKKRHLLTYPVRVTGNITDPDINKLSPSAIGKATINFIFDTITFPLDYLPGSGKEEDEKDFDVELNVPNDINEEKKSR